MDAGQHETHSPALQSVHGLIPSRYGHRVIKRGGVSQGLAAALDVVRDCEEHWTKLRRAAVTLVSSRDLRLRRRGQLLDEVMIDVEAETPDAGPSGQ